MANNLRSNVYEGGLTSDPSTGAGVPAAIGSILPRRGTTELWQKTGAANTAWTLFSNSTVFSSQGWYGSGIDGAATIAAGTTTLTRVMEWTALTVQNGGTLAMNGWYVLCTQSATVDAGGVVSCDGADSTSAAGGLGGGGAAQPYQRGGTGGNSPNGAGAAGGNMVEQPKQLATAGAGSSKGGAGGAGAGGAGGAGGTVNLTALRWTPLQLPWCLFGAFPANALTLFGISSGGGAGGGTGAATGGGGGGGGGGLGIAAPSITNNGAIQAKGGAGFTPANVNAGGGGGGGGGKVFLACRTFFGNTPDVSGGVHGNGNGTGANGSDGSTGYVQILTGV